MQVIVPDPEQEAARDLLRAREAVRGDLMRARHRVSKLLLRHGIVYPGQENLDRSLRAVAAERQRFDAPARQLTFEDAMDVH